MGDSKKFSDVDLADLWAANDGSPGSEGRMDKKLVVIAPGESVALELVSDEAVVTVVAEDDGGRVGLRATVQNTKPWPVELDEVSLIVRDADGAVVDFASHWFNTTFHRTQELVHDFLFPAGVLESLDSVELWVDYDYEIRHLLAVASVEMPNVDPDDVPPRFPIPLELATNPDGIPGPPMDIKLTAFCALSWEPELTLIAEVSGRGVGSESFDVVVALRASDESIVAHESMSLSRGSADTPSIAKLTLAVPLEALASIVRVDVALLGTVEAHESLGRFQLMESH